MLKKLVNALESPRPKWRYYVTFPAHLVAALQRLLAVAGLDWSLRRISRGGRG